MVSSDPHRILWIRDISRIWQSRDFRIRDTSGIYRGSEDTAIRDPLFPSCLLLKFCSKLDGLLVFVTYCEMKRGKTDSSFVDLYTQFFFFLFRAATKKQTMMNASENIILCFVPNINWCYLILKISSLYTYDIVVPIYAIFLFSFFLLLSFFPLKIVHMFIRAISSFESCYHHQLLLHHTNTYMHIHTYISSLSFLPSCWICIILLSIHLSAKKPIAFLRMDEVG
jgi:hypothetical protein